MKKQLKDYFIPHEGNDYVPHSLQKAAIFGLAILVVLSFAITNIQSLLWVGSDWLISTVLPAVIVDLTNDERSDGSLGQLKRNSVLDVAATLKAQHMAQNEYFSHYSPDGVSPWHWFGVANYNFVHAGENLAIHFTDSSDVVEAWMKSPTHRENIMNGDYTEIGVGTAEGTYEGFKTVYVVQLFGTPAAAKPAPVVEPEPEPVVVPAPIVAAETTVVPVAEDNEVLAESVAITETVEVIEAEPEPVLITKPVEEMVVEEMTVDESGVALYSGHIATSAPGVPATTEPVESTPTVDNAQPGFFASLATQPQKVLEILYIFISLFVFGALLLSILIELRKQQPVQLAYSVALLVLMFGLYQLHSFLNGGALVV